MDSEKRKPHFPEWKAWITIIILVQMIAAFQSNRIHQQMWEEIYHSQSLLMQMLKAENEYYESVNQVLETKVEYCESVNQVLEAVLQELRER